MVGILLGVGTDTRNAIALGLRASGSALLAGMKQRFASATTPSEIAGVLSEVRELPTDFTSEYVQPDQASLPARLVVASHRHAQEHNAVLSAQWGMLTPLLLLFFIGFIICAVIALYLPLFNIPKIVGRE